MRPMLAAIILCTLPLAAPAADAGAAAAPQRGEAQVLCLEQGPACDGELGDPIWQQAPAWPLGKVTEDEAQPLATTVRMIVDPTHLSLGFRCAEPDTEALKSTVTERDGPIWGDDNVEIFLRADPDRPYRHLLVNPGGAFYDSRGKDASWNSSTEWKTAVQAGEGWTATLRIPLIDLGAYVGENQYWTANFHRGRPARGEHERLNWSWSVMSSVDFHQPGQFGVLIGIDVPQRDDGVTRVRETPPPKPLIPIQGEERDGVTVYYDDDFAEGTAPWNSNQRAELSADDGALRVHCTGKWGAATRTLAVRGSQELRLAFHMRSEQQERATLNVFDVVAQDNTTAYGHALLDRDGSWTAVRYRLDRFRYNSSNDGFVGRAAGYRSLSFYGPTEPAEGHRFDLDNVVLYRGADRSPPGTTMGLSATPDDAGVELSWQPAEDNVAVQGYAIARATEEGGFHPLAFSPTPGWLDRAHPAGALRYRVRAVDFEENLGPWSETITVQSEQARGEVAEPPPYVAHLRAVHVAGAGAVRRNHVMLFGDSLTYATSYRHQVAAALGTATVDAHGYPGKKTGFGKQKIAEDLAKSNPEIVCVLLGTNNSKSEDAIAEAMADLRAIVETCEAQGRVAILGTIPPRGFSDPASAPEARYNDALHELARELRVPVAPIFERIQGYGADNRGDYLASDGVHWHKAGFTVAGRAWAEAVRAARLTLRTVD